MIRMESLSYSGEFVSVLLDDGSNSGEESFLFEKIGIQRFSLLYLSFQLLFEGGYCHRYEFIVPQDGCVSRSFCEFSFKIEQGVFVTHESREFVWSGDGGWSTGRVVRGEGHC